MPPHSICPNCSTALPPNALQGLCPRCLLTVALGELPPASRPESFSPPPKTLPRKNRSFGDYELTEEIARGGMGVVFKARQISLNRWVALKLIAAGALATEDLVRRFKAEAEAAASLNHPHIVPIYEIGEHEGAHFFSMGLIEGGSLAQRRGDLGFPPSARQGKGTRAGLVRIAEFMVKVTRAVHFAHQRGLLHRDIKPANILVDSRCEPHLTDFGLAKILADAGDLTHTVQVLGTPNYMSPEQARGRNKGLTTSSDVYSLGVVLYELLTGKPPFTSASTLETLRRVAEEEPKSPRLLNPLVDPDLETICLQCLQKEPHRRYPSADALAADLESWIRNEPIQARPISPFERAEKWVRRSPSLAAALLALLLVGTLGFLGVIGQWRRAERQSQETSAARDRATRALRQMEVIQLQRAEEWFQTGDRRHALPYLALVLRENPHNRVAAERLMSTLSHRNFARLACPPLEHAARVNSAAFSRDGSRVLTCAADFSARIWDANTGQLRFELTAHNDEVISAEFSPDGSLAVTASDDRTARVWDAATGRQKGPPLVHEDRVWLARFSPDGTRVLTGCLAGDVFLWDASNGQCLLGPLKHGSRITNLDFSLNGELFATASRDKTACIWNTQTGQLLHRREHSAEVESIRFSPDGKLFATASHDETSILWDLATGQPVGNPLRHDRRIWTVEFSRDQKRVVTASGDKTARIWDWQTGEGFTHSFPHQDEVRSAVFSPDGLRVLTSSRDNTARVWDAIHGQPLTEPIAHKARLYHAEFHPDGRRVLTASNDRHVFIWDITPSQPLTLHTPDAVWSAEFSPDGAKAALGIGGGASGIWDLRSARLEKSDLKGGSTITSLNFSGDGKRIIAASDDVRAQVVDAANGRPLAPPLVHEREISSGSFSPDGKIVLTSSYDHTARLWDGFTGKPLTAPLSHSAEVDDACFSPDGALCATASRDHTARVWVVATGQPLTPPLRHNASVASVRFHPNGRTLLTASADKTAQLWDIPTGAPEGEPMRHPHEVKSAEFSPDGRRILTLTIPVVRVWHNGTELPLADATPPIFRWFRAAQFHPAGDRILTRDERKGAEIWDADTGERLSEPLQANGNVLSAQLSPDGKFLLTGSGDRTSRLWEAPAIPLPVPSWLPTLAEAVSGLRFNTNGLLKSISPTEAWEVRQLALAEAAAPFYGPWAEWFFGNSTARPISPSIPLTQADYVKSLLEAKNGGEPNIIEATHRDPEQTARGLGGTLPELVPAASPASRAQTINLTSSYNAPLEDFGMHRTSAQFLIPQAPAPNNSATAPAFDVRGVIQLASQSHSSGKFPERITGIRISRPCRTLHFLHGALGDLPHEEGDWLGSYVVRYADGAKEKIPIVYGEDLRNWNVGKDQQTSLKNAREYWRGTARGSLSRLFHRAWTNPRPQIEVLSLDFISDRTGAAPFLLAITAE